MFFARALGTKKDIMNSISSITKPANHAEVCRILVTGPMGSGKSIYVRDKAFTFCLRNTQISKENDIPKSELMDSIGPKLLYIAYGGSLTDYDPEQKAGFLNAHNGNKIPLRGAFHLMPFTRDSDFADVELICVEEAQFFPDFEEFLKTCIRSKPPKNLVVASLDSDVRQIPFTPWLLGTFFTKVKKLRGICHFCKGNGLYNIYRDKINYTLDRCDVDDDQRRHHDLSKRDQLSTNEGNEISDKDDPDAKCQPHKEIGGFKKYAVVCDECYSARVPPSCTLSK